MVTLPHVFLVIALVLVCAAVLNLRDRRWLSAVFWSILAVPFAVGDQIAAALAAGVHWPAQAMGAGVIGLAVVAARTRSRPVADARDGDAAVSAARLGNRLFIPALAIPVLTFALLFAVRYLPGGARVFEPKQSALIALGVACVLALIVALRVTGAPIGHSATESRRLLDAMGWAVALPMMLASLGIVFTETGVGAAIAEVVRTVVPTDNRYACVLAYAIGMILFTVITGNAFTAFPVLLGGIGLPFLIRQHGANPAALGALGMVTGYCGTLLTPMAANFNIVPVLLLELRSDYSVIREQRPTALALIVVNLVLMATLVFA